MPQQGRQRACIQRRRCARGRAPRCRKRSQGSTIEALERRRCRGPLRARRALQHIRARVGRVAMEGLDQRQAGALGPRAVEGDAQFAAPVAQAHPIGAAGGQRQAAERQRAGQGPSALGHRQRRAARAQVRPQRACVEGQVQHQQRQGGIAEQVVPVEHRQVLVGDPENPQARGGAEIGQQQQAGPGVECGPGRLAAAPGQDRHTQRGDQQRHENPGELGHGTTSRAGCWSLAGAWAATQRSIAARTSARRSVSGQ
jgi:hypothetical protein